MATAYDYYEHYMHTAIGMFSEMGYIRNELDWDILRGKFTLRLYQKDGLSKTVLVTEFQQSSNTITVIDATTHERLEYQMNINQKNDKNAFHKALCEHVGK